MPYFGSNSNAEMQAGINHVQNQGHANLGSITLGDEASSADQGLDATSDRWNDQVGQVATTARSVLAPYSFSRSANGSDGQNYLPNGQYLGNSNGQSADSFDKSMSLRMASGGSNLP